MISIKALWLLLQIHGFYPEVKAISRKLLEKSNCLVSDFLPTPLDNVFLQYKVSISKSLINLIPNTLEKKTLTHC